LASSAFHGPAFSQAHGVRDASTIRAPMTPKRRLKRGVFRSIFELQATINRFLEEHNQKSQPFKWTADPGKIIAAVRGGHQMLDSVH
jgi:hypothetical protein